VKRTIVEVRHGKVSAGPTLWDEKRGVTYQREYVHCGKATCRKKHGPYWYAYWRKGSKLRTRYIGKAFRALTAADVGKVEAPKRKLPKRAKRARKRRGTA
jgi:hypothetical protein